MTTRLCRAAVAVLAAVVAVLALGVGTASAHVSVSSPDAAPGGFAEITFRMPSESDTARTTSLRVQLPTDTPFAFVSVKPVPGWTATTTTTPLDPPVEAEGSTITEAVGEVTWTADPGGGLAPGEYQSFSISAGPLPEDADSLVFPAVQGYDDGSTVAWIEPTVEGQPEPENPAPMLTLPALPGDADAAEPPAPAPDTEDDSGTSGLAVTALVVGIAGLLAGVTGVALALGARRAAAAPAANPRERDAARI
ncbi:MAG TPA: YcnI family protein [Geodermatophilus sp.]|nr:YcnI family protein [Geodermatophilus sp.]